MKNEDVFNELEVNGISDIMQKKKKKKKILQLYYVYL